MTTGAPPPLSDDGQVRGELHEIVREVESLAGRVRALHGRLAIPPGDDLMLVGEAEPVFLHVARVVLECVSGDYLEPLLRDLRRVLEDGH
ncbi:MAG TPA: hypothetical protein VKM72_28395 [Thermoanaerobaculia bacterium]|nr:hypothetical protein [Thermoanaerobaculia bacterium]